MTNSGYQLNKQTNWLLAALYGAVGAIIIACGASYLITHLGYSVVKLPEGQVLRGPEVLKLAALNLYAVQHITLVGAGKVVDPLGAGLVSARITLPLTVWIIIPAIGLSIGGYASARMRAGNKIDMITPAVFGGILYALILAGASCLIKAKIGSFLLPEIEGIGANPPPVLFQPGVTSTFIFAGLFGLLFMYLGSLLAIRQEAKSRTPGRWWACVKTVIVLSVVFQLVVAVASVIILNRKTDSHPITTSTIEAAPTVTGIAYSMLYGASLCAEVSSQMQNGEKPQTILSYNAKLYQGTTSASNGEQKHRAASFTVIIVASIVAALIAFLSGCLAVRWGSTDGSIPTAMRLLVFQVMWLVINASVCRLALTMSNRSEAFTVSSSTIAGLGFSWIMVPALLAYFLIGLLGAYTAHKRFSASPTGFPHTW